VCAACVELRPGTGPFLPVRTDRGGGVWPVPACRYRAIASIVATVACTAIVAVFLASCSGKAVDGKEEPRAGFQVPAMGVLVLALDDAGVFTQMGASVARVAPRPFPVAVSAVSIEPLGEQAILAVNRLGLRRLRAVRYAGSEGAAPDVRLLIENLPGAEAEFAGRTVAPSWSREGEALFLLYRHPIFEIEQQRTPASVVIAATDDSARLLVAGVGGDAFAVYPVSMDAWMVQARWEKDDRILTGYTQYTPASGTAEQLERKAFEKAVLPMPIAKAAEELRVAVDALDGQLLVEARLADGTRKAYVRGDPGAAAPAWAQVVAGNADGLAAIAVTDDWRLVVVRRIEGTLSAAITFPVAPVEGARARDAALVGGLVVVLWEEDLFPDIGASGMLVFDPGL